MAGESSSSISESRKVKDVLRRNPWPPEIKLKPKEIRNSPKMSDKVAETRQRTDEPMLAEPAELSLQAAKEIQTDEDEYLLPKSITDVQSVASDEYVRLNIEKESRENITKNTNENIEAPPPPPRTPAPPPRPPPKTYKTGNTQSTASIIKQAEVSEDSSDSSEDELDVAEILMAKPDRSKQKKHYYDVVNYGGKVQEDGDERKSSGGSMKEKNVPHQKETRPQWMFKSTEIEEAEDSIQTDKDGSFAVIQENEDLMPCTPYTLIVVHNGQLKRLPFMKQEGKPGKEIYSLGNSKFMKSIEELVAYFQTHEIGALKLKLLTLK